MQIITRKKKNDKNDKNHHILLKNGIRKRELYKNKIKKKINQEKKKRETISKTIYAFRTPTTIRSLISGFD